MAADYVKSLTASLSALSDRGMSYKWLSGYSSLVHNAREISMGGDTFLSPDDRGPLHGKCTYKTIIWIDSDISWEVEDFMKLVDTDQDILTGAYLLADGMITSVHSDQFPSGIPKEVVLSIDEPTEVQAAGFGFIAIKQGIFERIQRPWFGMLNQAITDSHGNQIIISVGEDISWCAKAQQAGFKIIFDPSILVTHHKTIKIRW
jgi:hypothetical protein